MIHYSVIIPHGNSLDTLARAIDSVPEREDIEVIVIDNSPTPIQRAQVGAHRPFKLLFSATERHAGGARNEGIAHAQGQYLLFLDADDFFNEDAFTCFDKYLKQDFDIVFFNVTSKYSDTLEDCDRAAYTNSLFTGNIPENKYRFCYYTPWCKLFKASFIAENGLRFDEVEACNDLMFSMRSGHLARKIAADDSKPYCVTAREGSLIHAVSQQRSRTRFCVTVSQCVFMKSIHHPEYAVHLQSMTLQALKNFGIKEFWWYLQYARQHHVSLCHGMGDFIKSVVTKCWKKDSYNKLKSITK